ncbi:type II toxin-antitoxin system antitoxin SocA domain-containing protein [Sodalis endosymbiont of Spalangia cameroni]|uniref:Panacea domain-containing protein n=1 Tax=Sodalis praecaptivus TaxID=1239307 RepID=UPI0031F944A3
MRDCFDLANYFLIRNQNEGCGDVMTNTKLQRLVYYAQVFALSLLGKPLFNEKIEASPYGPVIHALKLRYRYYKNEPLPVPLVKMDMSKFTPDEAAILDKVHRIYGQYSGWKLREMARSEHEELQQKKDASQSNAFMLTDTLTRWHKSELGQFAQRH